MVDHKFKDVIVTEEDGTRVIDYGNFHEVIPLTSSPAD